MLFAFQELAIVYFFCVRAHCLSADLRYLKLIHLPRHDRGPVTGGNRSAASYPCTVLRRASYQYATRSPRSWRSYGCLPGRNMKMARPGPRPSSPVSSSEEANQVCGHKSHCQQQGRPSKLSRSRSADYLATSRESPINCRAPRLAPGDQAVCFFVRARCLSAGLRS